MERLALFDLDGTLFNGRIWQVFIQHHFRHKRQRDIATSYVIRNVTRLGLYQLHFMSREALWDRFARDIGQLLRGLTPITATPILDRIYHEGIVPRLDANLLARWEEFGRAGLRRFVISGSPQPMLTVVGRELGATAAFGTELEQRDGYYTGRVNGPLCQGNAKAQRLTQYIEQQGWQVDWAHSYSFADSFSDRPILELAGQPTAVRPDALLRRYAQVHNWPIFGEDLA